MNISLSKREKIMLLALGVVIIMFLGVRFFVMPAASKLSDDSGRLASAQVSALEIREKVTEAQLASKTVSKNLESAKKSASALMPSIDWPTLHMWILSIANQSGLDMTSIKITSPVPAATVEYSGAASSVSQSSSSSSDYSMGDFANAFSGIKKSFSSSSSASSSSSSSSASSSTPSSSSKTSSASGNVLMATITLQFGGNYSQVKNFLDAIERSKRCVLISSFDYEKNDKGYTFTITLQCYAAQKLQTGDSIYDWGTSKPAGKKDIM